MPQVSASKLLETWNGRVEAPIAPQANLQTDGSTFRIAYSQTWDALNLKHVFEMEVHRILPSAQGILGLSGHRLEFERRVATTFVQALGAEFTTLSLDYALGLVRRDLRFVLQ